jgi:hypothetical protein
MAARKPVLPVIAVCCVLVGWLVWACVPAVADTGFGVDFSFSPPQGFNNPVGLAVDNSGGLSKGDVYVADQGDNKLEKFSAAGVLLGEVEVPGTELNQVAIEQYPNLVYEGDVYVAARGSGVVYRYGPELVLKQEIKGLSEPVGVAVDEAGDIFVSKGAAYEGKVFEFNAAGEPINASGTPDANNTVIENTLDRQLEVAESIAVDASGKELYIADDSFYEGVTRFALLSGAYVPENELPGTLTSSGVTLTPTGNVLVDHIQKIVEYSPSGAVLAESEPGSGASLSGGRGIGVNNESGEVYVADRAKNLVYVFEEGPMPETPETTTPTEIGSYGATLSGVLKRGRGNDETSGYYFSYGWCEREVQGLGCVEYGAGSTSRMSGGEGEVRAEVSGLNPNTQYTFWLVATNKHGATFGQPVSFDTSGIPPRVESELPTDVGASGVTVTADINPGGYQTTYHVEYGPTNSYGSSTPEMTLGTGTEPIAGHAQLTGLAPNTQYHYRVVASNEKGSGDGSDASFTTFASVFHGLPDGRVYEQVSRQENQERSISFPAVSGALDGAGFDGFSTDQPFQSSLSGDAVVYGGEPTSPGGTGNGGLKESNQYLATRNADGGWSQVNLQPPGYHNAYYQAFSSELSTGVLTAVTEGEGTPSYLPPLTPSAPVGVKVLYSRVLGEEGYRPLFTAVPPTRETGLSAYNQRGKALEAFGVPDDGVSGGEPAYAGSSADGSRLIFEANDALVPGAEAGEGMPNNLYESVDGQLNLVNVPAEGSSKAGATFGGSAGQNGPDFEHVISEDGSRVFWTDLNTGIIYVREDGTRTVQVSAESAQYRGATLDGKYVLYIEKRQLWRFDVETETRSALTPEGSTANVRGVIGLSADGDYVYFVARGVLAEGATEGESNIYLFHGGVTSFIATLENGEGEEMPPFNTFKGVSAGDWAPGMRGRTAEVTPDGRAMVFMSTRSLTGYDNVTEHKGQVSEVYVYEADGQRLVCVSCNRSGEPPYESNNEELRQGNAAGFLPISWSNTYLPQWISDDGSRVFFDSDVPLVPADTNNRQDVYEWERDGSGSCQESGGCIYLISGGLNPSASWLISASASGNDVFFVTRAKLTPEDGTEADVLYDARVDGVQPPTPAACTGTGCQGLPPAPPVFATPASVTFSGVGNFPPISTQSTTPRAVKPLTRAQKLSAALKTCKGKRKKRRASCEARARARYGKTSHASKASKGRK